MPWQSAVSVGSGLMPELPEVEVVKNGLALHLPGRTITGVRSNGKSLRQPVPLSLMERCLPGTIVSGVKRRAKYLLVELDSHAVLIIHLGMTGKLGLFPINSPELKHDHVFWQLDNGLELRFNDTRRFGSIALLLPEEIEALEETFFKTTGPEPFDPSFCTEYLQKKAKGRSQPIKNFIMDSSVVAGVGNIYANESLFGARIRPTRAIGSISRKKWQQLIDEIRTVLTKAIACGGSTISDFIGASGESGYFQVNFTVYGRQGQDCPRCSRPIRLVRLGGRASFFCQQCQR
jgi:formamidopyrimidine-DNA glycosylase